MTAPEAAAPAAAPAPAPEKPKGLTIEVNGKTVPAILIEKGFDGSAGTLVPRLNANTACKTCFGTGYVRHGSLIHCECVKEVTAPPKP